MNKKFFELSAILKESEEKKDPSIVGSAVKGAGYGVLATGGARLAGKALGGVRGVVPPKVPNAKLTQKVVNAVKNVPSHLRNAKTGRLAAGGAVIAGGLAAARKIKKNKEANA